MARRKHRRVRPHWQGCGCPIGTERVDARTNGPTPGKKEFVKPHPLARGFLCIAPTSLGPRFVRADCSRGTQRDEAEEPKLTFRRSSLPPPMREQLLTAGAPLPLPPRLPRQPGKPKKARLDWDKCKCPKGSELRTNKRGIKFCWKQNDNNLGGKIVAADC